MKSKTLERVDSMRLAGRAAEAVVVLRQAITEDPNNYQLHDELGETLCHLNRVEEGIGSFMTALRIRPDSEEACYKIGLAFCMRGMFNLSITWFERAITFNPAATRNFAPLGRALMAGGCYQMASKVYQQWIDAEPDNPMPRHLLSAVLGSQEMTRASPEYVRDLFNRHAPDFDTDLARLKYCGPEVLVRHLSQVSAVPSAGWDILDVGCGTGLAGVLLRPLARRLTGVDLSRCMLDVARARNIYDEVIEMDLIDYLRRQSNSFDVIAAADVLPYLGDLSEFFRFSRQSLRAGGFVVIIVEALCCEGTYRLNPTGRFSHNSNYLRRVMGATGLDVVQLAEEICRHEGDEPVPAFVAIGAKTNS
jgi:predicted TPR repeat methyltransferase